MTPIFHFFSFEDGKQFIRFPSSKEMTLEGRGRFFQVPALAALKGERSAQEMGEKASNVGHWRAGLLSFSP